MRTLLPLLVVLALALPAQAHHCATWTTSTTDAQTIVVELPADAAPWPIRYVANDLCQPGCLWSIWLYYESNGIPGLQRDDEVVDDTCHGAIEGDSFFW